MLERCGGSTQHQTQARIVMMEDSDDGRASTNRDDCDGDFAEQRTGRMGREGASAETTRSIAPR